MRKRYFGSLRRQVGLLTTLTVLVIFIMAAVFFSQAQRLTQQKTSSFVHTMLVKLGDSLNRIGEEMTYIGNSIHSNETVQQYFHAQSATQRMAYGKTFIDFSASLLGHSSTVSHIVLVSANQSVLSASEQNIVALDDLDERYGLLSPDNLNAGFYGPAFDTFTSSNLFAYVQPIFNTRSGARFNEKLGTCVIFARTDLLDAALSGAPATPGTVLLLVDGENQVISSTNKNNDFLSLLPASIFSHTAREEDTKLSIDVGGVTHLVDSLVIDSLGWRLVSMVPKGEISVDLMPLMWLGMLICLIFSIITAAWSIHIHRSITTPITALTTFIENDLDEKLQNRIHISTVSEIELFCQEINNLLDKVSEMTAANIRTQTRMYEMSLAKKRAEFAALQSQINPHFLYNTLDCLRGYGYMLGSNEIVSITNSLSAIMRYCIKGNDVVSLREEIHIVNLYLDIIHIRFAGRFTFVFDVEEGLMDISIPRVILQPVVENALYYGLEPKAAPGTLTIACHRTPSGDCQLQVTDDGVGITPDRLRELRDKLADSAPTDLMSIPAGNGLGLINIHHRLRNHYGDRYGLTIQCPPQGGTCVTLLIPFLPLSLAGEESHESKEALSNESGAH